MTVRHYYVQRTSNIDHRLLPGRIVQRSKCTVCSKHAVLCTCMQACEALVLVFDASSEASLHEVQRWLAADAADAAEVRLVVANKVDRLADALAANGSAGAASAALQRSAWLTGAQAWCSEHLFEYIEARARLSCACSVAAPAGCCPCRGWCLHKRLMSLPLMPYLDKGVRSCHRSKAGLRWPW